MMALFAVLPAPPAVAQSAPDTVFRDCFHCPEMVVIPAGSFTMGAADWNTGLLSGDGPRRRVTIGYDFAIGVHEVTFDEWEACTDGGGCGGWRPGDYGWGRGRRPVTDVSWDDAQAYVAWLSAETGETYRLPSEAEWEYAARAGTETPRYWGEREVDQCLYANGWDREYNGTPRGRALRDRFGLRTVSCSDGFGEGTAPVGTYEPNAFGLYDTIGNLAEWVEDCNVPDHADAPVDGSAWSPEACAHGLGFRVVRAMRPPG